MIIDYDLYVLDKKEKAKYYISSLFTVMIIMYIFYANVFFSLLIAPVIVLLSKKYYVDYLKKRRKEILKSQFMELLQSISASMSAGRQMGEALDEGLEMLKSSYANDSPLVMELSFIVKSIKESREGEEKLLRNFAKRAKNRDITSFVDIYSICVETGGDIEKAIVNTSQIILEKLSIEKEMKVLSAQKKFEGKLISLMPVMIILFLKMTSPSYIEPLYSTIIGRIVMTLSIAGIVYAYFLTDKITNISI